MKKAIFFVVLMILLIGFVSASENVNTTNTNDTLTVSNSETIEIENNQSNILENTHNVKVKNNESSETPTLTTYDIGGKVSNKITLYAIVKNSTSNVSGVKVTFKFNGATYTAISDNSGVASIDVKCPKSKALDTLTKYNSKKLTKTTEYFKSYTATADIDRYSSSFNVYSMDKKVVKYKVAKKKTKIVTMKIKKGIKTYRKGKYGIIVDLFTKGKIKHLQAIVAGKFEADFIKFSIKEHHKEKGKWYWNKWLKVPKQRIYDGKFLKSSKIDKIKIKYTQTTYKKI